MIEGGSVGLGRSDGAQRRALLLSALLVLAQLRVSFAYSCAAVCTRLNRAFPPAVCWVLFMAVSLPFPRLS